MGWAKTQDLTVIIEYNPSKKEVFNKEKKSFNLYIQKQLEHDTQFCIEVVGIYS